MHGGEPADWLRASFYEYADVHLRRIVPGERYRLNLVQRTGKRRILDAERIIALLEARFGNELVPTLSFTNCSLKCQIHLFSDYDIILAPHGAGETNMWFMRPHTVLIEAFPPYFYEGVYMNMAGILQLQYISVTTYNSTYFPRRLPRDFGDYIYSKGISFQKRRKLISMPIDPNKQSILNAVEEGIEYLNSYRFKREVFENRYFF